MCATRLVGGGAACVLEARPRVGGRLLGRRVGDGVFDLGASGGRQGSLAGRARRRAGVARAPQHRLGEAVVALARTAPRARCWAGGGSWRADGGWRRCRG
ncbi:MAG: hypothetical protein HS111_35605 [Kofleriaceae bacterium]|nr:hypothetical protein [Kofleriaceae bacterium]